jgi:hypothetical protein
MSDTVYVALKNGLSLNIEGFILQGTNREFGAQPTILDLAGYAFTAKVSTKIWDAWFSTHQDSYLVEHNRILADPDLNALRVKVRRAAGLPAAPHVAVNWRASKPYMGDPSNG